MMKRKLITEQEILKVILKGKKKFEISGNEIITPAARDKINEAGIKLVKTGILNSSGALATNGPFHRFKKAAIGSDHTGFAAKKLLISYLEKQGYTVKDTGTFDDKSCDYPDFAVKVCKEILKGEVYFGILLDATGIPSAIAANKFNGIRAATCYNEFSARSSREHNNANCLVLGAKTLGDESIKSIVDVWLNSEFMGERHQRRLDKITEIEKSKQ